MKAIIVTFLNVALVINSNGQTNTNEDEAIEFLSAYDKEYGRLLNLATIASWNYETNITNENAERAGEAWFKVDQYNAEAFINASDYDITDFSFDTKRQLSKVN